MAPLRRARAHLSLALGLLLAVALQASQQLAIADELHRHKQQAPAHYRNQQQQQQPHAAQSNAAQNDLVPPPDTPARFTFSTYNNFRPQRHIQAERAPEGGRAVINGNRATYVEPPADFTPIIYEPLAASGRPAAAAAAAASPFEEPAESFDSPNQLLLATGAAASASQRPRFSSSGGGVGGQQPAAASNSTLEPPAAVVMGGSGGGGALEGAGEQALDDNEQALPLKPSVGRWSDWHDMSIEPDLAASDSQPEASALVAGGPQAYRTRYGAPSADGPAITAPAGLAGSGAPKSAGGQASAAAAAAADEPRSVRLLPLKVELQQAAQPQPQQQHQQHQQQPQQPQQRAHSFSGNLIRMQQAPGVEYALAANQFQYHRAAQFAPTHLRPLYLVSPALEHPPPSPMHFLIAHNHHYQQQQQLQQPRQFQQFAFAANQLEPVRGAPWLAASSGGAANEINALPMAARANCCAERPSKNLFVRRLMLAPAAKRHRKAPQVERKNAEVRLIPATGSSAPAGGKPVALAALAPPPPAQLASGPKAAGANSSAPAAAAGGKPRLLKRRRIVSTRPVGLSSWFLGGMRDLDARFWKLPAELLNKLAVNDVDLAHPEELGGGGGGAVFSSIVPGAHEPEAIAAGGKPSELELAGPPLASTAPPRNLAAATRPIK